MLAPSMQVILTEGCFHGDPISVRHKARLICPLFFSSLAVKLLLDQLVLHRSRASLVQPVFPADRRFRPLEGILMIASVKCVVARHMKPVELVLGSWLPLVRLGGCVAKEKNHNRQRFHVAECNGLPVGSHP